MIFTIHSSFCILQHKSKYSFQDDKRRKSFYKPFLTLQLMV
ncbi:hypothetical protein HMPREF2141_02549 [Bacteroides uniformis]|nr:hypothetical protein HMPREF2141_02549 [Bacteroides uniformis]